MRRRVLLATALGATGLGLVGCAPGGLFDLSPATGFKRRRPRAAECFTDPGAIELAEAVQSGDVARIEELAGQGVDVAVRGVDGVNLWDWALRYGQGDSIRALAAAGADPDHPGWLDRLPVFAAHSEERIDLLALLLDLGADIDGTVDGQPLLFRAVGRDDPALDLLLARGVDLEALDSQGETALFPACRVNSFAVALRLLEAGVDPSVRAGRGKTFQVFLFGTPEEVLNEQTRAERSAVVAWLEAHDVPIER